MQLAGELRPSQCILTTDERILEPTPAGKHSFWFHNIYILTRRNPEDQAVIPLRWHTTGKQMWLTDTTFEGDRFNSSTITVGRGANLYVGGARLPCAAVGCALSTWDGAPPSSMPLAQSGAVLL